MSKSIQRLLDLRQRLEDDAAAKLARARANAEECRAGMTELSEMRTTTSTMSIATAAYCDELVQDARVALARYESESAVAEAVVVARRRDRKQMEHLLGRIEERAAKAASKREQKALDEWAVSQWERGSG